MEMLATIDMTAIAGSLSDEIMVAIALGLGIFAITFGVKIVKHAFIKAAYDGPVTGFYDSNDELHIRSDYESDEDFEDAMNAAMSDGWSHELEESYQEYLNEGNDSWDGTMLEDEEIDFDDPDVIAFEEACQASAARMSLHDEYTYDDYLEEREG